MGKTVKNFYTGTGELTNEERAARSAIIAQEDQKKQEEIQERLSKLPPKEVGDFMNAPFEPFEDRILVFPDPVETKTAGGLYKPDEAIAKVKPLLGTVVKFGPGKKDNPLPLSVGMRIYYGNYAGTDIELPNKIKYLVMRYADVMGKEK